jgi:hypothetical protein
MHSDTAGFETLHAWFVDRLEPACAQLLEASVRSGEIPVELPALQLMRGVGNLCIGAETDPDYQARRLVALLLAGLRRPQ